MKDIKVPCPGNGATNMKGTALAMLTIYEFLANGYTPRPPLRTIAKYIDLQWPRKANTSPGQARNYIDQLEEAGDISQIRVGDKILYSVSLPRLKQLEILQGALYDERTASFNKR